MPFIELKTSAAADSAKCEAVKAELGRAIALVPGKSEGWLMVNISCGEKIWFRGDASKDSAMVKVAVYGKVSDRDADRLTSAITKIVSDNFGVDADRVYGAYSEHDKWGWNGSDF